MHFLYINFDPQMSFLVAKFKKAWKNFWSYLFSSCNVMSRNIVQPKKSYVRFNVRQYQYEGVDTHLDFQINERILHYIIINHGEMSRGDRISTKMGSGRVEIGIAIPISSKIRDKSRKLW